jgi:hypothetical protein
MRDPYLFGQERTEDRHLGTPPLSTINPFLDLGADRRYRPVDKEEEGCRRRRGDAAGEPRHPPPSPHLMTAAAAEARQRGDGGMPDAWATLAAELQEQREREAAERQEQREREVLIRKISQHYRGLNLNVPPGLSDVSVEHLQRHWGNLKPDDLASGSGTEAQVRHDPIYMFACV